MATYKHKVLLGGIPLLDSPVGEAQSNWFEIGTGARPGEGRVLVKDTDWQTIADEENLKLRIWVAEEGSNYPEAPTVDLPVIAHSALPFALAHGTILEGVIEVHLHDQRFVEWARSSFSKAFNVQKDGAPYADGDPLFFESTLSGGSEWTWPNLFTELEVLTTGWTNPTTKPRNLVFDRTTKGEALERLLHILHVRTHYDWAANTQTIMKVGTSKPANEDIRESSFDLFPATTGTALFSDKRYPDAVKFSFKVFKDSSADPYDTNSRWYEISKATGTGGAGYVLPFDAGYWYAKRDEDNVVTNDSELDALADYWIDANIIEQHDELGDLVSYGIHPFTPDGKYRRILWTFNQSSIATHIRINSDLPIHPLPDDVKKPVQSIGSQTTIQTPDGLSAVGSLKIIDWFPAVIDSHSLIAGESFRYRYGWYKAILNGDDLQEEDPLTESGTTGNNWAINLAENANTATYVGPGVDPTGPSYPEGFSPIPYGGDKDGGTHPIGTVMFKVLDIAGNIRYVFSEGLAHDGECE